MTVELSLDAISRMTLKQRFMYAVCRGDLGQLDNEGAMVTAKQFKQYFSDINPLYVHSFLPAATIEIGQYSASRTRYLFRVRKGVYRVHADVVVEYMTLFGLSSEITEMSIT